MSVAGGVLGYVQHGAMAVERAVTPVVGAHPVTVDIYKHLDHLGNPRTSPVHLPVVLPEEVSKAA